jgi:hypothetical protein
MEVRNLGTFVDNLLVSQKDIETKRYVWENKARQIIIDCFIEIVNKYNIGLDTKVKYSRNLDTVYLYFIDKPSEFVGIDGDNNIRLIKKGGVLMFYQTFNGEIAIDIENPSIEFVKTYKRIYVIDTISPFDITKDSVLNVVKTFLIEMTNWESSN